MMRRLPGLLAGSALLLTACNRGDARIEANARLAQPAAVLATLPAPPAWSRDLVGRPFATAFADTGAQCLSAVDGVVEKRQGGVGVMGWGWDKAAGRVVERVVLVDGAGRMVGFGDGHVPRGDVSEAIGEVKADDSGWLAYMPEPKEKLTVYGLLRDGRTCPMGPTPQP